MFPRRDGPLIGRDLEISIAERALLDAATGGNRTLIISGEAGAGKSSLLAAIAARATERGFLAGHEMATMIVLCPGILKESLRRLHSCKPESLRPRRPDIT